MTEIARMRFKSLLKPKESGKLLLHDDGTIQIQPSEALRQTRNLETCRTLEQK